MEELDTGTVNDIVLRHVVAEDAVVRAYVYASTRGHRDTEDVIQEVWQVVCRKIGDYDETRSFRAWVLKGSRGQVTRISGKDLGDRKSMSYCFHEKATVR
jgi:hypothetical protein